MVFKKALRIPLLTEIIHRAVPLQASRLTNAYRSLIEKEKEQGPDFMRFANILSAIYPKQNREKRLPDVMLLAVP